MSMYDRDWYRESYKEKEEKYGGDFSLHSKPKEKQPNNEKTNSAYQNLSENQDNSLTNFLDTICPILGLITLFFGHKIFANGLIQFILLLVFLCTPAILKEPKGSRLKNTLKAIGIFFITLIGGLIIGIAIIILLTKYGILQF